MKLITVLSIAVSLVLQLPVTAQTTEIDELIAANRKGEITIKTKPNTEVIIEQVRHEF